MGLPHGGASKEGGFCFNFTAVEKFSGFLGNRGIIYYYSG